MSGCSGFKSSFGRGSRIRTCDLKYPACQMGFPVFPIYLIFLTFLCLRFSPCYPPIPLRWSPGGHQRVRGTSEAFEINMAPATTKLTKRTVAAAARQLQRYVLWDSELKGFGLRVEASGTKTFPLRYRPKGAGRTGSSAS